MALRFACPECGESITVKHLKAGELAECKNCHRFARVPVSESTANKSDAQPAEQPLSTPEPADDDRTSKGQLSPEERQRIYEEEKERAEAQKRIKQEADKEKAKQTAIGCLALLEALSQ